jgi:hypothetical protein
LLLIESFTGDLEATEARVALMAWKLLQKSSGLSATLQQAGQDDLVVSEEELQWNSINEWFLQFVNCFE